MGQEERIQKAYRGLGGKRTFYDGMITCSTLSGRAVCRLVWGMGRAETRDYLSAALAGIPEGFSGSLLEVPVGTGILTMPLYREMSAAELPGLDDSPPRLDRAICRGVGLALVRFPPGAGGGGCLLGTAVSTSCSRSTGFMRFRIRRPPGVRSFVYCGQAGSSAAASMCGDKTAARTGWSAGCMCQRAGSPRPLRRRRACGGVWRKHSGLQRFEPFRA